MQSLDLFAMNNDFSVQAMEAGNERQKIIIIDNLILNPQLMVDFAIEKVEFNLHRK